MRTLVGVDALAPDGGVAVAIGTFDGLHLGHRALIARTTKGAARLDASSAVLTWDRHPAATLRPDQTPPLLSSNERKAELIAETGVDVLAVLPFDRAFSERSPEDFIEDILVARMGAAAVFVGHDWRFGHRARGDLELLREFGDKHSFEVHGAPLQEVAGEAVTSSRTRRALGDGDMALARALLGRPFDLDGVVIRGAARGKALGFPTANLAVEQDLARPPSGIYAGTARVDDVVYAAAISIGSNPTFTTGAGLSAVSIEAYILDFDRDIYERRVRLAFWERLRDEQRFDSTEALVQQIGADVQATAAIVGL